MHFRISAFLRTENRLLEFIFLWIRVPRVPRPRSRKFLKCECSSASQLPSHWKSFLRIDFFYKSSSIHSHEPYPESFLSMDVLKNRFSSTVKTHFSSLNLLFLWIWVARVPRPRFRIFCAYEFSSASQLSQKLKMVFLNLLLLLMRLAKLVRPRYRKFLKYKSSSASQLHIQKKSFLNFEVRYEIGL